MNDAPLPTHSSAVLPPELPGIPMLGSLPKLLASPLTFVADAQRQLGDIFMMDLGFAKAVVVCHPKYAQHILVDNARNYSKAGPLWDSLRTFMGNALPTSEGDFWKRQRRLIQPAFHHQQLAAMTDAMVAAIDEVFVDWERAAREGKPFEVMAGLSRVTMNLLVRTMFGGELTPEEADKVATSFVYILHYFQVGMMTQSLPKWVPVPGRARYRREIQVIDEVMQRIIDRGRKSATQQNNLLSLLLNMVDAESGEGMTDQQLRDESVAMFVAGYETTAAGMCWLFHVLTQYPDLAARMHTEVDEVLGGRAPRFSDVPKLSFTRNLLMESFRVYSPSIWIPRMSEGEDEINGFKIPAGRMMVIYTHQIHVNPDVWEHPHTFDPDRFTPERSEGRHKLAWLPFGAGQRLCIGKEFTMLEAQLIMARLAQRFVVAPVPGREPKPSLSTTLRTKDGMWMYLKPREGVARQQPGKSAASAA